MALYFYKLIPPRPTFPADISESEMKIMHQHVAYWKERADSGQVIVFGPVADPTGAFGIAIVQAESEAAVHALGTHDPAVNANAGFSFEVFPMPRAMLGNIGRTAQRN